MEGTCWSAFKFVSDDDAEMMMKKWCEKIPGDDHWVCVFCDMGLGPISTHKSYALHHLFGKAHKKNI